MMRALGGSGFRAGLAASAALLISLLAQPAHALLPPLPCEKECLKGYACEAITESNCAPAGCAPGQTCTPPPPCEPTTTYECVPVGCSTDTDCADGMVCATVEDEDDCATTAVSCAPGQDCTSPPPSQCPPPEKHQQCLPRYALPCTVAADCGAGFECKQTTAECSASSEDPTPKCTPTGPLHCTATLTECNFATDCPSGWTCIAGERGGSSDGDSSSGSSGSSGDSAAGAPLPPESHTTVSYCAPPYYDVAPRSLDGVFGTSHDDSGSVPGIPEVSNGSDKGATKPESADDGGCQMSTGRAGDAGTVLLVALGAIGLPRRRARF